MLHAEAAALLVYRVSDDHVARRLVDHRRRGIRLQSERALDVHGSPAVQKPVPNLATEGRHFPLRVIPLRHHV